MTTDTMELTLPAHWAAALINGDTPGLAGDDGAALGRVMEAWRQAEGVAGMALTCAGPPFFARYHDAYPEVLACDCLTYTFRIKLEMTA